jgi:beta-lactamase class A
VIHVEAGRTATVQGERPFPLFSVFKLPLAVAVLQDVQAKRLSLERKVRVTPSEVVPGWKGNTDLWRKPIQRTVRELLDLSVVRSDNTASDQLLKLVGGPTAVTQRMRALGLEHIDVRFSTKEFVGRRSRNNTGSPADVAQLLAKLKRGQVLQPPQQTLLLQLMTRTKTGLRRLRGKLPADTPVADKTGSGDPESGTHDVGLITLPGGKGHLAMAVLITGSTLSTEKQEDLIAELARVAFDWYVSAIPSRSSKTARSDRAERSVHHSGRGRL